MDKRRGFTLVEILVVVTIIASLTGLVISSLSRIRHTSRVAGCRELIKQVGLALDTYAADFRKYPEDPWQNWNYSGPGETRGLKGSENSDSEMAPGYPSYVYWLINNPRQVYMNMKDASFSSATLDSDPAGEAGGETDNETIIRKQKDVLIRDVWGKPMLYVKAPDRRILGEFLRAFPNSGKYNLWSVGPDEKCGSCDWGTNLDTNTVTLTSDAAHADGCPDVDPLGPTKHVGGHKKKGSCDDIGNW